MCNFGLSNAISNTNHFCHLDRRPVSIFSQILGNNTRQCMVLFKEIPQIKEINFLYRIQLS